MAPDKFAPRIAVYVDLDLVGDALIKLPMVRALRHAYPDAELTWIAGRGPSAFASLLAPLVGGLLDHVMENAGTGPFPMFDLLIDTQSTLGTALALRRSARRFVTAAAWGLPSRPPRLVPGAPRHLVRRLLALLEQAAGKPDTANAPLALPKPTRALAARLLPEGPRYVAQVIGAGGKHKVWPLAHHVTLARALLADGDVPVIILGPDEAGLHTGLATQLPAARFPLQEAQAEGHRADPPLTIALAAHCAAGVAADCGGGHMLASAGIPLVSLFGPTDPGKFAPFTPRLTIIRAQDHGSPDMSAIPPEAVRAQLQRFPA